MKKKISELSGAELAKPEPIKKYYPCPACFDDWIEYQPGIPLYIGTYVYSECGDGCCTNRFWCPECNGDGVVYDEVEV